MLQISAIEPATLALLKKLMSLTELNQFNLAGGTALALRYGHRLSVDLDLFSNSPFSNNEIITLLENHFPTFTYQNSHNPIGIFGYIDNIKVDFVKYHHHPPIGDIVLDEGVRLFSDKDLIAMKINAVLRRAVKKDFWDIAELLNHYSLKDVITFYDLKFKTQQLQISIPYAITYFEDAEESENPVSLREQTWEGVKSLIKKKVNDFLK
ncbi:nucleotidyl transferase AbiEii/AbiGii toxin family protein [Chitinophagaceae bacterium LWZ2-11]